LTQSIGFAEGKIVERFDCYEGTSAKAKLSKDLYVQGVNFLARKPQVSNDYYRALESARTANEGPAEK
jgi:hypothetical protein